MHFEVVVPSSNICKKVQALKEVPSSFPAHYVPSVDKFAEFIVLGLAYGMLNESGRHYVNPDFIFQFQ